MNRRSRLLVAVLLLVLPSVPCLAASKLIHMRNGRILRASQVDLSHGGWVYATLSAGHTVGFPTGVVALVEDDLEAKADDTGENLNVVSSGRFIAASPAAFANQPTEEALPAEPALEGEETEADPSVQPVQPPPQAAPRIDPTRSRTPRFTRPTRPRN